jgi:hypothetical protein
MARQSLNLGAATTGAGGDTPRSAFTKCEANFVELFTGDANSYKRANIIGTVSQSGGTPTGAAMQYITNANGQAIRFADGTQIAARAIGGSSIAPGARQSGLTGNWAAAFASVPYAIPTVTSTYPDYMSVNNEAGMTSSQYMCSVQNRNAPVAVTPTVYVVAVGRWY